MNETTPKTPQFIKAFPVWFLAGLVLVNVVAIFQFDPLYIGAFFSFFYIVLVPGLLVLPFFIKKQLPLFLGLMFSLAISVLLLMLVALGINTALPFWGISQPLTTLPLLLGFDVLVYVLLAINFVAQTSSPLEMPKLNGRSWRIVSVSTLLPLIACLGAIRLNNGDSDLFAMIAYLLSFFLILVIVYAEDEIDSSVPPYSLYMMALTFLLMNSMRGWFITGHDIMLEFHVFSLVNNAHHWSMSLYQDPYMACLSITLFPVYLQNLLHISGTYIFKFFLQFVGAGVVVAIYYLSKEYVSKTIAFLAALSYLSFPTFMTDMSFLNRQGIALLFFGILLFVMFTREYFDGWRRHAAMLILGAGMVLSHYSTSYVALALFLVAYIVNIILRFIMTARWPRWFSRLTDRLGNKEMYHKPVLLNFLFVLALFGMVFLWSGVITKTSNNLSQAIQEIAANIENPFSSDHAGVDQYSIIQFSLTTPQELFDQFIQGNIAQIQASTPASNLFPLSLAEQYTTSLVPEPLIPLSAAGNAIQKFTHVDLANFYNELKQAYAYIMQFLLLIGLVGIILGYSFKKNLLRNVPGEYVAITIAGIVILVGQTILPSDADDYGLLRLFQQNLIFLGLPIILGLLSLSWVFFRTQRKQLLACSAVFLFFFATLSGLIPEWTGGARPALPLNNYGFYYDAYYAHAQEISSIDWIAANGNPHLPIQTDHYFSGVRLLAYANIVATPGLFPETIEKNSYVYLGYNNVKNGTIIEYAGQDVVYYSLPMSFLANNKDLIYNDGGSEIYY